MATSKEQVIDVIRRFYGDLSRTRQETLDELGEIIDEAQSHYDMLRQEIDSEEPPEDD